jgi:Fe-S cluster assembly protein SufD
VDTKPQLEIFADDVKCTHGATIGQLEPDALFYLQARGIDDEQANGILVRAFAAEALERIRPPALRERMEHLVAHRLARGSGGPHA